MLFREYFARIRWLATNFLEVVVSNNKNLDTLEVAVHVIIILLGISILAIAYSIKSLFFQTLLISIGSSLVVVTILFIVFELFRRRNKKEHKNLDSEYDKEIENERSNKYIKQLHNINQSSVMSNAKKVLTNPKNDYRKSVRDE